MSYDYVGDLAETVALIWPTDTRGRAAEPAAFARSCMTLRTASRSEAPAVDARGCSTRSARRSASPSSSWSTGGLRIGVSARLAKQALADFGGKDVTEIEELWHGLRPPYAELFAWLEGRAPKSPPMPPPRPFRPVMLSNALEERDARADLARQTTSPNGNGTASASRRCAERGVRRLYSRTGDDISGAFPDLVEALDFDGAIDGELLVGRPPIRTAGRARSPTCSSG